MLCPKQIYASKNKLNYTVGWPKGGKKTHCKGCFKPPTQRAIGQDMPEAWAKRKRNHAHSLPRICKEHKPRNGESSWKNLGVSFLAFPF